MALTISDELFNKNVNLFLEDYAKKVKKGAAAFDLTSDYHQGLHKTEGFLEGISDMIEDRDMTSNAAQAPTDVASGEITKVSHQWKTKLLQVKPTEIKRFTGNQNAEQAATLYFAREYASAIVKASYNIGIGAAVAAIGAQAQLKQGDGTTQFDYSNLNSQLAKFGDASSSLTTLIMRGLQWHSLVGDASTAKAVENVMGATINTGDAATFGRNAMVYDADTLLDTDKAYVLSVVANAISINESESRELFFDKVGTNENIMYQFKFEGAFDIAIKGYSYSKTAGGTKAEILTSANWTKVAGDKLTAGTIGYYSN